MLCRSTVYTQADTHPGAGSANCCWALRIGRELVSSTWYDVLCTVPCGFTTVISIVDETIPFNIFSSLQTVLLGEKPLPQPHQDLWMLINVHEVSSLSSTTTPTPASKPWRNMERAWVSYVRLRSPGVQWLILKYRRWK